MMVIKFPSSLQLLSNLDLQIYKFYDDQTFLALRMETQSYVDCVQQVSTTAIVLLALLCVEIFIEEFLSLSKA